MILTKIFQTNRLQELHVSCNVDSLEDIDNLPYDDYDVVLYISGRKIADIGTLLDKADLFMKLIDDINWKELYAEKKVEDVEFIIIN